MPGGHPWASGRGHAAVPRTPAAVPETQAPCGAIIRQALRNVVDDLPPWRWNPNVGTSTTGTPRRVACAISSRTWSTTDGRTAAIMAQSPAAGRPKGGRRWRTRHGRRVGRIRLRPVGRPPERGTDAPIGALPSGQRGADLGEVVDLLIRQVVVDRDQNRRSYRLSVTGRGRPAYSR